MKNDMAVEDDHIRIASISTRYSVADGFGNRMVVYLQGCSRRCEGCHNMGIWDFNGGSLYSVAEVASKMLKRMKDCAKNVTISGGEPLNQLKPLLRLIEEFNRAGVNVCVYTGYEFDEVPIEVKNGIDYLKTGAYIHKLRTTANGFFGSTNQNFWAKAEDGRWKKI